MFGGFGLGTSFFSVHRSKGKSQIIVFDRVEGACVNEILPDAFVVLGGACFWASMRRKVVANP